MNTGFITLRKCWPALAAVAVLAAIALAAGTLFAANERQQPELPATSPQSVASATGIAPAVEPPVVPPAPERVFFQSADNDQEEVDLPPIPKEPPKYPNLDSNLNRLVGQEQAQTQPAGQQLNATGSAVGGSGAAAEPVLVTFYVDPAQVDDVREYLEDNGVFVRNVGEDYIEAHVQPLLLPEASQLPGVRRVDTVIPPRAAQSQTRVISQGVGLHGADAWHNADYRGQSVKVGVIDTGFEGFRRLQGSELPANVTARCYSGVDPAPSSRLADCEAGSDHGTAVAETLVDVAPDVELYIANPYSNGDLRNAVDWMAGQGVQVINYSVGDVPDGPGDGTSPFSDSPLRTIDAAVSGGITWVTAAGNSARTTWYGTFRTFDTSATEAQIHYWSSDDTGNTFSLLEGESVSAFMRWDDSWGQADCDLDLVLWRSFPALQEYVIIDSDLRLQNGSQGSYPFANVGRAEVTSSQEGLYFLTISKKRAHLCPDDPAWIQLIVWIDDELQYHSPTHHMGNPEESRNPGQLAVGATHYWNTGAIAAYSSRGPALDGRTKPDITGVACGQSAVIATEAQFGGQCGFAGTSASAPHVAGLAALVRQRFPDYTPAQTVDYLQRNASERGTSGKDNTWGHGLASLPDPATAPAPSPAPAPQPGVPPTANIAARDGANAGEVILSWDAVAEASHYRIGYVNMETDYPLAKASVTQDWINAFIYVDEDARNLPVSGGRVEYTLRRLAPGVRHALTVLTSNDVAKTTETIGGTYYWPQNPRWRFHTTR